MSITGLMNQTITISTKSGYNAYGRETVGVETDVVARFQKKTKMKVLPNGSVLTIEAIVYVPSDTVVGVDDKVTYSGSDYKVHGIYEAVDGQGRKNHLKIELIKWKAT